ncbi:MAG: MBL fold metallo-hydrolase [Spirochaetales bacterium]|nr:MBL fold metallo-hydrolase [Spirochaetales bacterium]
MKLAKNIFFYEGDYVEERKGYFNHYRGMGSSNYLVVCGENCQVMIDTGMPHGPHKNRHKKELSQDKIDLNKTTHIFFSHLHPDHVILAKELSKKSGHQLKFLMHQDNENYAINADHAFEDFFNLPEEIKKEILIFPSWLTKFYLKFIGMSYDYVRADHFFKDKDVYDIGTKIEIIELPAHCPGHVGYYFPDEKIFYSADLFDSRISSGAGIMVSNSSYDNAFKDIERIENMDIAILVPGHGRAIYGKDNIKKTLSAVRKGTQDYLSKIVSCLPPEPALALTLSSLTDLIFLDSISYNAYSRRMIIYNCLKYLQKNHQNVKFSFKKNKFFWFYVNNEIL